jgi:cytochrome c heme-lyase
MWPFSSSISIPAAPPSPPPAAAADKCPVDEATRLKWLAAQQSPNPLTTPSSSSPHSSSSQLPPGPLHPASLSEAREISTIPRHSSESLPQTADPHAAKSYTTPESSNWVYPSESQFYRAMERKNHNPNPADMKSIVPIHNAVNERAWKEVLDWEKGLGGESCGGVKLVTFKGTPGRWSPKSLANRLLFG